MLLLVLLLLPSGLRAQGPAGAPVVYRGETLFLIRTRVGSFTPEARARAITERLELLTQNPFAPETPLRVEPTVRTADLYSGDMLVLSVNDDDAAAEGTGRLTLAHAWAATIHRARDTHSLAARIERLSRSAVITLGILLALGLTFFLTGRAARTLRARVEGLPDEWFPSLRWQRLTLLSSAQGRRLFSGVLKGLQWALTLVMTYLCLSLSFSLFPWTRGLAGKLLEALASPLRLAATALLDYLPHLLILALLLAACRYLLKLLYVLSRGLQSGRLQFPGFHRE